jgi:glycosyltransferase involved in cell wall biosynthesis
VKAQVGVVIPVFNGARYLEEAIESIAAASSVATEVVVVDDASTDDTAALVGKLTREHRHDPGSDVSRAPFVVRALHLESNVGPALARNAGVDSLRSDYVAFLDADDRYAPHALDVLRARLDANLGVGVAMGRIRTLQSRDKSFQRGSFELTGDSLRCFQLGSVLVRADVMGTIDPFDASLRHGEDIDWFFRLQEAGVSFDLVDHETLQHRRHDRNLSDEPEGAMDIALVLAASLRRRRAIAAERHCAVGDLYYIRPDRIRLAD